MPAFTFAVRYSAVLHRRVFCFFLPMALYIQLSAQTPNACCTQNLASVCTLSVSTRSRVCLSILCVCTTTFPSPPFKVRSRSGEIQKTCSTWLVYTGHRHWCCTAHTIDFALCALFPTQRQTQSTIEWNELLESASPSLRHIRSLFTNNTELMMVHTTTVRNIA